MRKVYFGVYYLVIYNLIHHLFTINIDASLILASQISFLSSLCKGRECQLKLYVVKLDSSQVKLDLTHCCKMQHMLYELLRFLIVVSLASFSTLGTFC